MINKEIKKIIKSLDERLILIQTIKEPINPDLDKAIKLSVAYEQLQKENKVLQIRIDYLERSNNRREETILSLRDEQQLDKYKNALDKIEEHIKFLGKYDGERCTKNVKITSDDFNYILEIIENVLGDDNGNAEN